MMYLMSITGKKFNIQNGNYTYFKYTESLKKLKKMTVKKIEFPTVKEWNKYAKENQLLSSESIKYIAGVNWHELRNRIELKK